MKILNKIEYNSIKFPNRVAYINNNDKITYEYLWKKSNMIATLLQKQGIEPVIIYGHKSIDMVVSIIACLIAKRTYIPIDIFTPISRIKKIINDSKATLIIKNETLNMDDIDCFTLKELNKFENEKLKLCNNETAYIIFTSGSTGDPKGVPISRGNLDNFENWLSNFKPLSNYSNINVLNQASFSFDLSVADLFYSLCNAHTLVALEKSENYMLLFDVILKNKINMVVSTPTFMKLCLLNPDFNFKNYSNLKCIYFCGEIVDKNLLNKLFERFPNITIINAYGPTEATSAISAIVITKDMLNEDIMPVGDVNNFATAVIIENDEIILKGASVFNGYLNNYNGGFYRENEVNCYKTGDIGYIKDGKLYCIGRKDNQIKYKGYRIEINDIENNIKKINGVKDCIVIVKYNNENNIKLIKAFVTLENNYDIIYVKEELQKLVPEYMIPQIIQKIDKIPINNNGKVDRKLLGEI